MANTSVSGLVSGLDTATIISQLMQIEAQPQTNLKNRVSAEQKIVTALQAINTKLAGIATKAADLAKTTTWSALTASSDNSKVSVTASSSAGPATLALTVNSTVVPDTLSFTAVDPAAKLASDGSTAFTITKPDGTTAKVTSADGTVQGLANAINSGSYGLTATLVQNATSGYDFVIAASGTGSTAMSISADSGAAMALTGNAAKGKAASITVNGTTLTSNTNTFKALMPGVDVTLQAGATGSATITISRDAKSLSDSVKAMVDAVNSVLGDISTQTGYNADTKTSGPLAGEAELRDIQDQLVSKVTYGFTNGSYASVGIQVDRYGKLTFDESKFAAAYAADPAKVEKAFDDVTDGLATKFSSVATTASDSYTGTLTLTIKGHNSEIKTWQDDISDWDTRLQVKQDALQRQYAALEVALGKMQDQASWLSGQIGSLPKSS